MRITVVIPCFNIADHLEDCLAPLFQDLRSDEEVICIDDGSTDGTFSLLQDWQLRYPECLTVLQQANAGAPSARNKGLRLAKGAYIQFLDADDILMPGKIERQRKLMETERADIVVGNYEKKFMEGSREEVFALTRDPWMALIKTELGTTSANMFRRSSLENIGGWDESLRSSQDYELMYRLMANDGKVVFDAKVSTLVLKREAGSISRVDQRNNWVRYIRLRCDIRAHLKQVDQAKFEEHINALDQYIFMAIRELAKFDVAQAISIYKTELGKAFKPNHSKAIDKRYLAYYNLLGFGFGERVLQAFKRTAI